MEASNPQFRRIIALMAIAKNKKLIKLVIAVFKFILKHPRMVLIFLVIAGSWPLYETQIARPKMTYKGEPKAQSWATINTWFRVFRNNDFMLGYSDIRGNALWVVYQIKTVPKKAKKLKRPTRFSEDWRAINRVTHHDYTKSGYDRGHLAPNYAISRLYGKQSQLDSFLMTNITPQKPHLNRGLWRRLEMAEIDVFTQKFKQIWVITGPVFTGTTERLNSSWQIEIPDAFYKIYVAEQDNAPPKMLAFLMPQKVKGKESLAHYITSVDEIETLTQLDFFSELEDTIENELEAKINSKPWRLKKVTNKPSQY